MTTIDIEAMTSAVRAAAGQLTLTDDAGIPAWRLWGGRSTADLIAQYGEPGPSMPLQLCNGMGVDTAAAITRLINDPDARVLLVTDADGHRRLVRVDLADITVVTAMTGNEFAETEQAMAIGKAGYWNLRNAFLLPIGAVSWIGAPQCPAYRHEERRAV